MKINRDRTQPADMREAIFHTIWNEFEKTWNRIWYLSKQMWNFYLNEHTVAIRNKLLFINTSIRPNGLNVSLKLVLFYWMGKEMLLKTLNLHEITVMISKNFYIIVQKSIKMDILDMSAKTIKTWRPWKWVNTFTFKSSPKPTPATKTPFLCVF